MRAVWACCEVMGATIVVPVLYTVFQQRILSLFDLDIFPARLMAVALFDLSRGGRCNANGAKKPKDATCRPHSAASRQVRAISDVHCRLHIASLKVSLGCMHLWYWLACSRA